MDALFFLMYEKKEKEEGGVVVVVSRLMQVTFLEYYGRYDGIKQLVIPQYRGWFMQMLM